MATECIAEGGHSATVKGLKSVRSGKVSAFSRVQSSEKRTLRLSVSLCVCTKPRKHHTRVLNGDPLIDVKKCTEREPKEEPEIKDRLSLSSSDVSILHNNSRFMLRSSLERFCGHTLLLLYRQSECFFSLCSWTSTMSESKQTATPALP